MSWASVNNFLFVSPESYQLVGICFFAILIFAWGRYACRFTKSRETMNELLIVRKPNSSIDPADAIVGELVRVRLWWGGLIAQVIGPILAISSIVKYVMQ
jgi:hypothetical protein